MRPRSLLLALLVLLAATAVVLRPDGGVTGPVEFGGEAEERAEALREGQELTEPSDAMLARQLFGSTSVPSAVFARAAKDARALGAETAQADPEVAEAAWTFVGPGEIGGRVLDITVDPQLERTIFVGTATGGVWRSDDRADSFTPAWPSDVTQAVGALAQGSDGTLWAGTGEAGPGGGSLTYGGEGVFRSTDRGATWENVGLESSSRIGRVVVDPANPERVFVAAIGALYEEGGERGLYVTEDAGESWKRVLTPDNSWTGVVDVALDPSDPKIVYATTWENQREPDRRRYTGLGSGLYRSTDGGATFSRIGTPLFGPSPQLGRMGITVSPTGKLWVISTGESGLYNGLFRSEDRGTTFVPVPAANQVAIDGMFVYGWWFGRVWVDPTKESDVYVAGVQLSRTRNGGQSWQTVGGGLHADHHAMAWDPRNPDIVFEGNDGGIWRSEDRTQTFEEKSQDQRWSQLYSVDVSQQDPTKMVAGLQDNGDIRSWRDGDDEDRTFREYHGGDGTRAVINPVNDEIVYGCHQYGECAVYNRGRETTFTNKVVGSRKNWSVPIEFDPANPATVFTGSEILSRSDDNGQNWTPISPELSNGPGRETNPLFKNFGTITTVAPAPKATGTIYVGTDDGNLWYTHNGGGVSPANWTKAADPDLPKAWVTRVEIDPADPQTAYATYSGFRSGDRAAYVLRTTDGGKSWDDITANLPKAPLNDVNVVGDRLLVAGDVGVFLSDDDGASWKKLGQNLPLAPVFELRTAPGNLLFAGTFGQGIWKVALP